MSESVNKYRHKSRENFENHKDEISEAESIGLHFSSPPFEEFKKTGNPQGKSGIFDTDTSTAGTNNSLEDELERELSISLNSSRPDNQDVPYDPDRRFKKACMNLVNQAREEFGPEPPENFEYGLAKAAEEEQTATDDTSLPGYYPPFPDVTKTEAASPPLPLQPNPASPTRPRSLATGMTVVLLAIGMTGAFLDVHKHPLVVNNLPWGQQSGDPESAAKNSPIQTQQSFISEEEAIELAARSDRLLIETADRPVVPVSASPVKASNRLTSEAQLGASNSGSDEQLDALKVNLTMTESYLARLQDSIQKAKPGDVEQLQQEASMIQREVEGLRNQLAGLKQTPGSTDQALSESSVKAYASEIAKSNAGVSALDRAIARSDASQLQTTDQQTPRDPQQVEIAMAATPGLKTLDNLQRNELRQKLVSGECLVPALTSVFPQVPVLVMRDMIQKLEEGC